MIHPHTLVALVSEEIGVGVFATRPIPRGTIVWTQDPRDTVYDDDAIASLSPEERSFVERYGHVDASGARIVCWDAGRLVNHSCRPSLRGVGPWMMVARRDLAVGDEITCDYAECNLASEMACECGEVSCRGHVHARDLLEFGPAWDTEALDLLGLLRRTDQPLWDHLLAPNEVVAWLRGEANLPSFVAQCVLRDQDASAPFPHTALFGQP